MKRFACQFCGNEVHFDSTECVACKKRLGYLPDAFQMTTLDQKNGAWRALADPSKAYMFCANAEPAGCNWLLPLETPATFCEACRHNRTVPDITDEANRQNWRKLEIAKRYLFYSLMRWSLPAPDRTEEPDTGLAFDFLADTLDANGAVVSKVMTGHDSGVITINILEGDDSERERIRNDLHEPYRTLLGHFRHEIGHYYWDQLVRDQNKLERFREMFGDERQDYAAALRKNYEEGPPVTWRDRHISAYAASHPWEDFAETWAHYIHMVDTLETARAYGIKLRPEIDKKSVEAVVDFDPYSAPSAPAVAEAWAPLTIAVNSVNRSMGQPDVYPFVLTPTVIEKLQFVHELIAARRPKANRAWRW